MKTLLFNDLYSNRKLLYGMILDLLLIGILMTWISPQVAFLLLFVILFGLVIISMNCMEENQLAFVLSLPVQRKDFVCAKFLEYGIGILLLLFIVQMYGNFLHFPTGINLLFGVLMLFAGYWSFIFPIKLYFGRRGQVVQAVFWMLPVLSGKILKIVSQWLSLSHTGGFFGKSTFSVMLFFAGILLFLVSMTLSYGIMKFKDC